MTNDQHEPVFPLLPYQKQALTSEARFRWSCWSRQTGKSFTMSLRRIIRGLRRRRNQIFLSGSERQSRELMEKARQHCQVLQVGAQMINSSAFDDLSFSRMELRLPNGVRVIGLPANPETIRGFTGDVFLDEFAVHADDREIWAAVFPTLLRGDGELDVASTPKGKSNMFYKLSQNERFERSHLTLPDAIEQGLNIDAEEIRLSMGDDELYRQEFLCEFLDESTAFITYEQIAACEDPSLEKEPGLDRLDDFTGDLFVGVDVGRKRDLTVFWVVECQDETLTTRAVFVRRNLPFRAQYELFSHILSLPRVRAACIDAGGLGMQLAESAVEDFGRHKVEPVIFTNTIKTDLAGRLRTAIEEQRIRIPADEALRNDFHSLRRTVTSGGLMRFEADRGEAGHADRFWAAALALRAAGKITGPKHCLSVKPLAFATNGAW